MEHWRACEVKGYIPKTSVSGAQKGRGCADTREGKLWEGGKKRRVSRSHWEAAKDAYKTEEVTTWGGIKHREGC